MEIRRYGSRGLLVLAPVVVPGSHPDVVEVVPGASTVLVVVRDADALAGVAHWVAGLEGEGLDSSDGSDRSVVLDVVYDGSDLDSVAAASGLSVDEVVSLHSGGTYRCDFCGFAPGFAYLSGLDTRLHLPRRATPRTSVPAGSVAIAGPYSAAYPSASPGGWHLLGRTDATLWDLTADPPALIAPGTTVRFNPIRPSIWLSRVPHTELSTTRTENGTQDNQIGGRAVVRVVAAGVATSLQDHGRVGYAHLAVPGSGAVDARLAGLVNRLVGNDPAAAVLETAGGLILETIAPAVVADSTTGAVQALTPGETITVNPADDELWAYLAIRGGFAAGPVLGSRSWDTLSRLGPNPPAPGDELAAGEDPGRPVVTDQAPHPPSRQATKIRVREGPRAEWFTPRAITQLTTSEWTVSDTSRVGARLTAPALQRTEKGELPSEGLVTGAIQVPPDGQPVVMLADHPTTGGYPVIATVEDADLGAIAQAPPGSTLRFVRIDGASS